VTRRVALVTGGGRGIGRAIAERLVAEGMDVVIGQLGAHDFGAPAGCELWELDVREEVAIQSTIDRIIEQFGHLDAVINNSALTGLGAGAPLIDHSVDLFERIFRVNLLGPFMVTKASAKAMIAAGTPGSIVNIASINAFIAEQNCAGYVSTKSGLLGLTRASAVDLAPYGIRVNAVAPGQIFTDAGLQAKAMREDGPMSPHHRTGPLGEGGQPEDVAGLVAFLVSNDARWMTGETVVVDGGYLAC
jgi:glucose 1-dehydrogenase